MALPALFTPVTLDGQRAHGRRARQSAALRRAARGGRHHGRHRRQRRLDRARQAPASDRVRGADGLLADPAALDRAREAQGASSPTSTSTSRSTSSTCSTSTAIKQILEAAEPAKEQLRRQLAARAREPDAWRRCRRPCTGRGAADARRASGACPASSGCAGARNDGTPSRARPAPARASRWRSAAARRAGWRTSSMLEAFDELGVKPGIIAGTSMGSICGAAYAAGLSARRDPRRSSLALFANRAAFFRRSPASCAASSPRFWSLRAPSVVDNVTLFEMLLPEAMHCDFAALEDPVPGHRHRLLRHRAGGARQRPADPGAGGQLRAARACRGRWCSTGRVLIDGGYINPVPYDVVMDRADVTVAVDVTGDPQRRPGAKVPGTLDLHDRAPRRSCSTPITREKLKSVAPDILIRPAGRQLRRAWTISSIERNSGRRRARQAGPEAHSFRRWLAASELSFPQQICVATARNLLHRLPHCQCYERAAR